MPSFRASEKELGKAFTRNLDASQTAKDGGKNAAALLLLFYAVECGLKHVLCTYRRGNYLADDDPLFWTHDLTDIVKELRFPRSPLPQNFRLARSTSEVGPTRDCHLAWRYGVGINAVDENAIESGLVSLVERIKQDIR